MRRACSFVTTAASVLSLAFLLASSTALLAQTKLKRTDVGADSVRSILWVGNSFFYYNNSMHNHFGNLVQAADPQSRPRGVSVTISGSGMDWHDIESYFRPNGIGRYSFAAGNQIVFNKPGRQFDAGTAKLLQTAAWEIVREYLGD